MVGRIPWSSKSADRGNCTISWNFCVFPTSLPWLNKQVMGEICTKISRLRLLAQSSTFGPVTSDPAFLGLLRRSKFILKGDSGVCLAFLKSLSPLALSAIRSLVFTDELLVSDTSDLGNYPNYANWSWTDPMYSIAGPFRIIHQCLWSFYQLLRYQVDSFESGIFQTFIHDHLPNLKELAVFMRRSNDEPNVNLHQNIK